VANTKIPNSKLSDIRQKYNKAKNDAFVEDTENDKDTTLKTLEVIKEIARDNKINETGLSPKEMAANKKEELASIKRSYKSDKKIEAKWNFEVGDLVEFQDKSNSTKHIGIVVDLMLKDKHNSRNSAKKAGQALVFSSAGRIWKNPAALRRID